MNLEEMNPNLAALIVSVLGALGAWAWRKARGVKQADFTELLDETITHEVVDALEDGETVATIESRLEEAAIKLSKRLGVILPRPMVNIAIAWGVVEFKQKARARKANRDAAKRIPDQVADLVADASNVADAFKAKGTIQKIGDGMPGEFDVEIVK